MKFIPKRVTKTYKQINSGSPDVVFPLLCPVREGDWLEDWEYEMIFSKSGLAEKGCIFTTPFNETTDTYWYVTVHNSETKEIEFLRMAIPEIIIKINIKLEDNHNGTTSTAISYEYTALNEKQNEWIENESDTYFNNMMKEWEKSINHYIKTGERLHLK